MIPFAADGCISKIPAGFVEVTPNGLGGDNETFCSHFLLRT